MLAGIHPKDTAVADAYPELTLEGEVSFIGTLALAKYLVGKRLDE